MIQAGSSTDRARQALQKLGAATTVERILAEIVRDGGPEIEKATLVSNLSRYVNRGDTFTRVSPNVYGLIEFKNANGANQ